MQVTEVKKGKTEIIGKASSANLIAQKNKSEFNLSQVENIYLVDGKYMVYNGERSGTEAENCIGGYNIEAMVFELPKDITASIEKYRLNEKQVCICVNDCGYDRWDLTFTAQFTYIAEMRPEIYAPLI